MVDLTFIQLLTWLIKKEGSEVFLEEKKGAVRNFLRKISWQGPFLRVKKGGLSNLQIGSQSFSTFVYILNHR